jgi:flavin-dependent dehydrogenase
MPRLWAPGRLIAGDGAGMVNVPRLKGAHLPMLSGMFAAETIVEALERGSAEDLTGFRADRDQRDRRLMFDKLGSVFLSNNATRDDAPDHIRIERKVPLAVG